MFFVLFSLFFSFFELFFFFDLVPICFFFCFFFLILNFFFSRKRIEKADSAMKELKINIGVDQVRFKEISSRSLQRFDLLFDLASPEAKCNFFFHSVSSFFPQKEKEEKRKKRRRTKTKSFWNLSLN